MIKRWLVNKIKNSLFYTYMFFHLYLIINKNTVKGMYLVIQESLSSNIWDITIFCESRIHETTQYYLYPNDFFLKYPVSR